MFYCSCLLVPCKSSLVRGLFTLRCKFLATVHICLEHNLLVLISISFWELVGGILNVSLNIIIYIFLSIHLSVCLSIDLSAYIFAYLSISLYIFIYLIDLSFHLSLSVYLPIYLSILDIVRHVCLLYKTFQQITVYFVSFIYLNYLSNSSTF